MIKSLLIALKEFALAVIVSILLAPGLFANEPPLNRASSIQFAEVDAGRKIMMTVDDYLSRLSPFDLAARMETDQAVTLEQFKEHLAEQVLPWSEEQTARLRPMLTTVAEQRARWELNFPETVPLLRSCSETYDVRRGGTSFDYLQFRLLEVARSDTG